MAKLIGCHLFPSRFGDHEMSTVFFKKPTGRWMAKGDGFTGRLPKCQGRGRDFPAEREGSSFSEGWVKWGFRTPFFLWRKKVMNMKQIVNILQVGWSQRVFFLVSLSLGRWSNLTCIFPDGLVQPQPRYRVWSHWSPTYSKPRVVKRNELLLHGGVKFVFFSYTPLES